MWTGTRVVLKLFFGQWVSYVLSNIRETQTWKLDSLIGMLICFNICDSVWVFSAYRS